MTSDKSVTEKRATPRLRTFKGGVIAFNNRSSTIDCMVRNLTSIGALLNVASTIGIPDRFELKLEHENFRWCRARWRQEDRMGVAFE
jgi:hypothetical protein